MSYSFEYAKRSIRGARDYQEDACHFELGPEQSQTPKGENGQARVVADKVLAVLADGMGGHVGGAHASRIACASFAKSYYASDTNSVRENLQTALDASNDAIAKCIVEDRSLEGMGCTLIGAYFSSDRFHWISVGDSLIYIYRDNKLEQVNADHSYASVLAKMVERKEISAQDAKTHPQRNALLSALMGEAIEKIDLPQIPKSVRPGDCIIIASDGLLTLSKKEIAAIIEREQELGAEAIVTGLLQAVETADRPRQDNATVMAICPYRKESTIPQAVTKTQWHTRGKRAGLALALVAAIVMLLAWFLGGKISGQDEQSLATFRSWAYASTYGHDPRL